MSMKSTCAISRRCLVLSCSLIGWQLCKYCAASGRKRSLIVRYGIPDWQRLLNILNLHDAAFGLRVLWILHHRHVQFLFIFAECNVCRAITWGNFKDVEQLPVRRDLQDLSAEPLGHIDVTFVVDLHAIRPKPWRVVLVFCENIQKSKIRAVTQRAISFNSKF